MPFTFSFAEYADMIYVYSFSDGNSVHAIAEYQQRFLNRRIPTQRVFAWVYQTLRDISTLPSVRTGAEHDVNEGFDEEGIVQMVQSSETSRTWWFCWEAGILQVAQWQWRRSVISCLLTKRNSMATASIIHTTHVWAYENHHTTVESNFQLRFSVNVWCAVLDDQLIGPFILEGHLTGEAYLKFLQ